jgi:hypothetical protein
MAKTTKKDLEEEIARLRNDIHRNSMLDTVDSDAMQSEIAHLRYMNANLETELQAAVTFRDAYIQLQESIQEHGRLLQEAAEMSPGRLKKYTLNRLVLDLVEGKVHKGDLYNVVIDDCCHQRDQDRIGTIKALRELKSFSLREAKEICDPAAVNPPQKAVVAKAISGTEAEAWLKTLKPYCLCHMENAA